MAPALPRRRPNIRLERLPDGSGVLYDPQNAMTYAVTASAVLVWEACDGTHSALAITERLAGVYDAPHEQIARDVAALLAHLDGLGLFEPDGGAAP
jgi:hypothetical protein